MESKKIHFLDGLRGLMAINVILCHFVVVYFPQMYDTYYAKTTGGLLSLFATTPLSVFVNGNIAVQYFFLLTGFLVGKSVFEKDVDATFLRIKSVNRYKRLLPMVIITTVFTFITMVLGLQKHLDISNDVANSNFLRNYCNFEPGFFNLLFNCFVCPFVDYSAYIGPFWTIRYEFLGYLVCLCVTYIFKSWKWRKIAFGSAAIMFILMAKENYFPFISGVFIADLIYNQHEDGLSKFYKPFFDKKWFAVICLLVGTFFACCPMEFTSVYRIFSKIPFINTGVVRAIGISFVLYGILRIDLLQRILSVKPLLFLGKISFEVYAFHWPIMLSLQAWLFSIFNDSFSYHRAALLAFVITLPVIYGVSYCVHLLINKIQKIR